MPEEEEENSSEDPSNDTAEDSEESASGEAKADVSDELRVKFDEAINLPFPNKEKKEWIISLEAAEGSKSRGIFDIFTKKDLPIELLKDLRVAALRSPGSTKAKIADALKKYPANPDVIVLKAICTYGMLRNSTSKNPIPTLSAATREVAEAIAQNAISLHNVENFIVIYFSFLEQIRRAQRKMASTVSNDPRAKELRDKFTSATKLLDILLSSKSRGEVISNYLKKKIKGSNHTTHITFKDINNASSHIVAGTRNENVGIGTAEEVIDIVYVILGMFARMPIMGPLVDKIAALFSESHISMQQRRLSIQTTRNLYSLKKFIANGEAISVNSTIKAIYDSNIAMANKTNKQSIKATFEADPFLNVAIATEMATGFLEAAELKPMVDTSIAACQNLMRLDGSKGHKFADSAKKHIAKLTKISIDNADE